MVKQVKMCSRCRISKPVDQIGKNRRNSDGLDCYCLECKRERNRANSEYHAEWYQKNKHKISSRWSKPKKSTKKVEYLRNKSGYIFRANQYRARKLKATPPWLSKEQKDEIKRFYWLSQDLKAVTGETYHVDHIVPLQGENVCGLNVPWNLQILPADVNIRKKNHYEDENNIS